MLALGSAGSNRLRSAILQAVVSIVDGRMTAAEAVRRPRIHPEGDGVDVEGGVPDDVVAALAADGHGLRRWGEMNLFFGGVSIAATRAGRAGGRRRPAPRRRRGRRHPVRRGDRPMTQHQLEVEGRTFTLEPQPIRTSLTDGPAMLWGFQVRVLSDDRELGIKTCFVGRVSVQFRDAAAPDGPIEALLPGAAPARLREDRGAAEGGRDRRRDPLRLIRGVRRLHPIADAASSAAPDITDIGR